MMRESSAESAHRPSDLFGEPDVTVQRVRIKRVSGTANEIPFMQRLTCTIKEACKVSGLGRTKFYELIKCGELKIISVGRRRLVQIPSLLKFLKMDDV
jgi:excisionase family DNA binding protein